MTFPEESSEAEVGGTSEPRSESDANPARSRTRRRRKRRPAAGGGKVAAEGTASVGPTSTLANLAQGLLSHIDDREVPCMVDGCSNTWTWAADEQIRGFGQPPPRRACSQCEAVEDVEVECSVPSCKRTWTWDREAQRRSRGSSSKGRGSADRGGRGRRGDGRPRRRCAPCQAKFATLIDRTTSCKVHGCTREVAVERDAQLRAWAALGTEDLEAVAPSPKRMCEVCREFCRTHQDRPVPCGRPGCANVWTYKTGAQLQAFLAGRLEDPVRLCAECVARHGSGVVESADGSEVMPCVVLGCEGTWVWTPGLVIAPAEDGQTPVDRMCEAHRNVALNAAPPVPPTDSAS